MRHRVAGKKLNRTSSHRKALAKNLMRSLIIEWQGKGHIVTTRSKAKFIQPRVEKLISLSRNKSVHNIRRAMSLIGDRKLVQLLFDEIGPYYKERPGGYTRLLRMVKPRLGDASVRAYLGYVREDDEYPEGDRRHEGASATAATDPSEVADSEVAAATDDPQSTTDAGAEQAEQATDPVPEAESGDLVVIENIDAEEDADSGAEEAAEEAESPSESAEEPVPDADSEDESEKNA